MCMCECVFVCVCVYLQRGGGVCMGGGSIPRHKLLSFLESLWPTQEERVGGEGGGGRGPRPWGNKALFQTCRKQGSLCCDAGAPLLCREMLSQRCNIHLGIGPGGWGWGVHRPPVLH